MKFYAIIISMLFIKGVSWSMTQNTENDLEKAIKSFTDKKYDTALSQLQKIDTSKSFKDLQFSLKYHWVAGSCLAEKERRAEAEVMYNNILKINFDEHPDLIDSTLVEILYSTGLFFSGMINAKKLMYCFQNGLKFSKQVYGDNSADWTRFQMKIALAHSDILGDYEKAFQLANNALSVWIKNNGELNTTAIYFYERISDIEIRRNNRKAALRYVHKALDISRSIDPEGNKKTIARIFASIAVIHYEIDNYEEATENLRKALKLYKDLYGSKHRHIGHTYHRIGNCFYQKANFEKALSYYETALPIYVNSYGEGHIKSFSLRTNIIACQINLKKYADAEASLFNMMKVVQYNPNLPDPFESINLSRVNIINIFYFYAKNQFFWYKETGKEQQLKEACERFEAAVRLVEHIHAGYEESGSKQYLLDRYYYVFEQALNAHYELYQCTGSTEIFARAISYTERSRAILLTETLRRSDAGYTVGLSDSLRDSLQQLRKEIIGLENRRYVLQQKGKEETPEVLDLNEQLYLLGERRRQLEAEAHKQYPAYARATAQAPPPTPAQIQARLQPGEAWLSYFCGEDDLYVFLVRKEELRFVHIPKDFPLEQWVKELRSALYDYPLQQSDSLLQLYRERAWGLYEKLLGPIAWELPHRLVMAPDGVLKYLPFEALLSSRSGDCALPDCPYLLRRYLISYASSATLWLAERRPAAGTIQNKVLAFAPAFPQEGLVLAGAERRSSLGALAYNTEEARGIRRFFRADVVRGAAATRERFVEAAAGYKVLHLATHAKADDENGDYSFLAFSREQADTAEHSILYARELYAMPLQAELVVLSACETGIGEFRRGEGLVSLAYGFAQAGARSIVTSLWRVNDRETADLMGRFYAGLHRGLPKDAALREAKLEYLSAQSGLHAHPFFWAAFVPQGDMRPLDMPGSTPVWVWVLVSAGILGGALYKAKRRRRV